jgi:hypothetical protein
MDQAALRARLEACLLTEEELEPGLASWRAATDPFPILADAPPHDPETDPAAATPVENR